MRDDTPAPHPQAHSAYIRSDQPFAIHIKPTGVAVFEYLLALRDAGTIKQLPPLARSVLLLCLTCVNGEELRQSNRLVVWPSRAWLARMTGRNRGNVARALAELRDMGLIRSLQQGGGRITTMYELTPPEVPTELDRYPVRRRAGLQRPNRQVPAASADAKTAIDADGTSPDVENDPARRRAGLHDPNSSIEGGAPGAPGGGAPSAPLGARPARPWGAPGADPEGAPSALAGGAPGATVSKEIDRKRLSERDSPGHNNNNTADGAGWAKALDDRGVVVVELEKQGIGKAMAAELASLPTTTRILAKAAALQAATRPTEEKRTGLLVKLLREPAGIAQKYIDQAESKLVRPAPKPIEPGTPPDVETQKRGAQLLREALAKAKAGES